MSEAIRTTGIRWTRERTALLGLVCVLAGTAGGWQIRGMTQMRFSSPSASAAIKKEAPAETTQPAAVQLKQMVAVQAAPLLEKLKADPASPDVLTSLGNVYYDAQQYPEAVDYYARVLRVRPDDAAVRTDMGTAFWFMGNADRALAEFQKALASVPDNPNTLFNLGMVKWKGKMDAEGATAAWERLLATDPGYEQKKQVEQMLAEVKTHAGRSTR
jgi:cytochrome c-type biogenesis protein CcmH/NrfG